VIHPKPATLEGHGIRLEPLTREHENGLIEAAKDGKLWELFFTSVPEPENTKKYVEDALKGQERADMLPWVVRDLKINSIVGSTRYHDIIPAADRVEIGYTWYAQRCQRTHVNTTCKLLLFEYGFEKLQCKVIGLRTDNYNFRSQRAIEALGAKKDGVIRHHWPRRDGSIRDTVMYSVLANEWPDVKRHLQFRLKRNETN
jgi:RimJ/RimL family protein N-acetyltransferase